MVFENIIESERCRQKADQLFEKETPRFYANHDELINAGRVTPPTLYFVIKRYLNAQNFKPVEFYQIKSDLTENFSAFLKDFNEGMGNAGTDDFDAENRLINKNAANRIVVELLTNPDAVIKSIETKRIAAERPQLYDIMNLQRDGNRLYGYGAADVLAAAQSLYELKIISQPRTDVRYLKSGMKEMLEQRIKDFETLEPYRKAAGVVLRQRAGPNVDGKIVDDEKAAYRHAIIVTENIKSLDTSKLNDTEKNVLHLVVSRMITALALKYVYDETTVETSCSDGEYILTAKWKEPVRQGYRQIEALLTEASAPADNGGADFGEEQPFPNIVVGQTVHIKAAVAAIKKTEAPKLHTEATLLAAMENAGAYRDNGKIIKGTGIGGQAARAEVIKKLFDVGYIAKKIVQGIGYIEPTKAGINYIKILPSELYSPRITAEWEAKIAAIASGENTTERFMSEYQTFINRLLNDKKETNDEEMNPGAKESLGICPFCKKGEALATKETSEKTADAPHG
jgi:DNA topoisomerase-3